MNKLSLKIQVILSYTTIITALIICLYGLGFMTGFYTLFMNGNDEMYTFFKELQSLNTAMFSSGLVFFVMALFLIPFDINKKIAGVFGVGYTLILAIINIISGVRIFLAGSSFRSAYNQIDFTILEDYIPTLAPFDTLLGLFGFGMGLTVVVFLLTVYNFLGKKREVIKSEK